MKIDIVIPAYNEEKNIGKLLNSIKEQTIYKKINKIFVISDSSIDNTHKIVKNFARNNKKIKLLIKKERRGKSDSLNIAFNKTKADILIMLDADISFKNNITLSELIKPLNNNDGIGMTIIKKYPVLKKENLASKISLFSYFLREEIISTKKNYKINNFYASAGCGAAIKKELFKKIKLPEESGSDQDLFFLTIKNKFEVYYVDTNVVYYNTPSTIKDFLKQNRRFNFALMKKRIRYKNKFEEYSILRFNDYSRILIKHLMKEPIIGFIWLSLYLFGKLLPVSDTGGKWEISISTK